jgi:hypothetical protein
MRYQKIDRMGRMLEAIYTAKEEESEGGNPAKSRRGHEVCNHEGMGLSSNLV